MENNFVSYTIYKENETIIFLYDIKKDLPTHFEWVGAIEDFKFQIKHLIENDLEFAFILDIRKLGLLTITQVKDFVTILQNMSEYLERKLICSSIISNGSIIKTIMGFVKMFYNTKKPLKIVDTMDEAIEFIEENKKLL